MAKKKTNGERLVCIEVKLDNLLTHFNNHLSHHNKILYICLSIAGTALVGGVIKLLTFLLSSKVGS